MKKHLIIFAVLCLCVFMPKTDALAAAAIKANKDYTVTMENELETKDFIYVMPKSGYFYFTVATVDGSGLGCIEMSVNYKEYESSDSSAGEIYTSGNYSFKKGTKVKISLTSRQYTSTGKYLLRVITKKPKNFEKEDNGSRKKATKLKLNKTYYGFVHKYDKDVWAFKVPSTGKYKMSLVITSGGYSQRIYVYQGYKQIGREDNRSGDGWTSFYKGRLKKGKKIYIIMDYGQYNSDIFYKIKIKKIK